MTPKKTKEGYLPQYSDAENADRLRMITLSSSLAHNALTSKERVSSQKRLSKLVAKNPAIARELGVLPEGENPVITINTVYKYACLSGPEDLEAALQNAAGAQTKSTVSRIRALAHDFYNALVDGSKAFFAEAIYEMMEGPAFRESRRLHIQIGEAYAAIRLANQVKQSKLPDDDPKIAPHLETIKKLNTLRDEVKPALHEEWIAFQASNVYRQIQGYKEKVSKVEEKAGKIGLVIPSARNNFATKIRTQFVAKGLHHFQCAGVLEDWNRAMDAAFNSADGILTGIKCRYQRQDGSFPSSVVNWDRWDGLGRIRAHETGGDHSSKNHSLVEARKGTNGVFRYHPITQTELDRFRTSSKVDLAKPASARIHLATLRIATPKTGEGIYDRDIYASVPFIMHRPLPEDGIFCSAVIKTELVGIQKKHWLLVTVKRHKELVEAGVATAEVSFTAKEGKKGIDFSEGQFGVATRTHDEAFKAWAADGPNGQRFSWLKPDGTLSVNNFMALAGDRAKGLNRVLGHYISDAIGDLKAALPETTMPWWFATGGFFEEDRYTRKAIARLHRFWVDQLSRSEDGTRNQEEWLRIRKVVREIRAIGRNTRKPDATKEQRRINRERVRSGEPWPDSMRSVRATEGEDTVTWNATVAAVQVATQKRLGLNVKQAFVFAVALMSEERYKHLYPWAVNLNTTAMARRKDEYLQFANMFLKGVKEVTLPKVALNQRFLTDAQKAASPASLREALVQVAGREGVFIK